MNRWASWKSGETSSGESFDRLAGATARMLWTSPASKWKEVIMRCLSWHTKVALGRMMRSLTSVPQPSAGNEDRTRSNARLINTLPESPCST
jgi:hypothetical protein